MVSMGLRRTLDRRATRGKRAQALLRGAGECGRRLDGVWEDGLAGRLTRIRGEGERSITPISCRYEHNKSTMTPPCRYFPNLPSLRSAGYNLLKIKTRKLAGSNFLGRFGRRAKPMQNDQLEVGVNRRTVLLAAAGAAPLLAFSSTGANAKMAQTAVAYQDSPKDGKQCDSCNLFVSPGSCKTVSGAVSPSGWCKIWVKKSS
jgi:hypothetical protein